MRFWTSILAGLLAAGWVWTCGAVGSTSSVDAAIQAIQQAPDPSEAVTAYANGFALARNDPRLYDAYVTRMVDLGLPEMAYHQAQTLTTLQSNNGLAWGVVAYVEARRAQMPEALAAINLAGQYAPDNKFVQHTAGELAAWYDFKADKATVPENTKAGLVAVRKQLQQRPAFTEAYATAQKAYQTAASGGSHSSAATPAPGTSESTVPYAAAPAPAVTNVPPGTALAPVPSDQMPPSVYSPPPAVPPPYPDYWGDYYSPPYAGASLGWGPDYYYGWGPGWVAPSPWWWWQPCGWWGGCSFFSFGTVFVFGDFDHGHHHDHDGDFHHGHDGDFHHDGHSGHGHDPAFWHNGSHGHNSFFGAPAHPSDAVTHWAHASSTARVNSTPNSFATSTGSHWWAGNTHAGSFATAGSSATMHTTPSGFMHQSPAASAPAAHAWTGTSSAWHAAPSTQHSWASGNGWTHSYTAPHSYAPSQGFSGAVGGFHGSSAPQSAWSVPSYRTPAFSTPHFSTPSQGFAGSMGGFHSFNGMSAAPHSFSGGMGGFSSGGSFGGGFHSSGGMGGGGFHAGGGAMSGGGHGGGGHR